MLRPGCGDILGPVGSPGCTEVVIAGGGPAGSSAAIVLASAGHRVTIVEKARFPRPRIGESLPPKIDALLAILGVAQEVASAGFVRMSGTTVCQGPKIATHDYHPDQAQRGYQADRARFDTILLNRARMLGAEVVEGSSVVGVLRDESGRIAGARHRLETGEEGTVAAPFLIDASGARSGVFRMLGARRRETTPTIALCSYYRGCGGSEECPSTNTLFEMLPDGWIWSVLLDDGRRNVTLAIDTEVLKRAPAGPEEVYRAAIRSSRLVGPLVEHATRVSELTAHHATRFSSDLYAGDGFAIVGDAGFLVDPVTSHGVYKAIQAGIGAAAMINTVVRRPDHAALAIRHHGEQQARAYARYADVALSFYESSPFATQPFWAARAGSEPEIPRSASEVHLAEQRARRARFEADVRRLGGRGLAIRARPDLALTKGSIAAGNFIVPRPILTSPAQPLLELGGEAHGVDVGALFRLLDGRPLEAVFEGYASKTGEARSSDLGRRLTMLLTVLVEHALLETFPGSP